MKSAIILTTLGGPRNIEEIPEFIRNFLGRELPAPAMKAIIERYRLIGGGSPLPHITEEQARKLCLSLTDNDCLCLPAFRYCRPLIEESIDEAITAGSTGIKFLLLSPFYADVTTGNYIAAAKKHLAEKYPDVPATFIHSWHAEPLFIECWAEKIRFEAFDESALYLFSAHSLPASEAAEHYRLQIEDTVDRVAKCTGLKNYYLGWQSIPGAATEKWITPTVEERIDEAAALGFRNIVQIPLGFTADHIETLYDIDITHRTYALKKGFVFRRLSSLNEGDSFIKVLQHLVTAASLEDR